MMFVISFSYTAGTIYLSPAIFQSNGLFDSFNQLTIPLTDLSRLHFSLSYHYIFILICAVSTELVSLFLQHLSLDPASWTS